MDLRYEGIILEREYRQARAFILERGSASVIKYGDCLSVLAQLEPNSIDSLVTDPPAGISFMGKEWDGDKGGSEAWTNWMSDVMRECYRVMKPGAHGLVWALPRTSHWTAWACERAGFEIRDCVTHLFGSGFPKSLDVSKAIDKAAGAEREKKSMTQIQGERMIAQSIHAVCDSCGKRQFSGNPCVCPDPSKNAITDAAKEWNGWGTALKPAAEFWWLIRKPCSEKTVAKNVEKWGTGAINIDASRVTLQDGETIRTVQGGKKINGGKFASQDDGEARRTIFENSQGRFPANLVLSHSPHCTDDQCDIECAVYLLDEQSGVLRSGDPGVRRKPHNTCSMSGRLALSGHTESGFGDSGGASRFFYCAKASKSDKGKDNSHPTVKSTKLMRYLIRLITPPKGLVLDPFMGSGSTGVAAKQEGFEFIGIERDPEYLKIAKRRIQSVKEATSSFR